MLSHILLNLHCIQVFTLAPPHSLTHPRFAMQVIADDYSKLDKELLGFIEDELLNRCENSTERMLEYAATLEPKCKPTDVKKLQTDTLPPKLNPILAGVDPLAPPTELPPVPDYKAWVDPLQKSAAFGQLQKLMEQRIIYIDGAMGTSIQKHKWVVQTLKVLMLSITLGLVQTTMAPANARVSSSHNRCLL